MEQQHLRELVENILRRLYAGMNRDEIYYILVTLEPTNKPRVAEFNRAYKTAYLVKDWLSEQRKPDATV